MQDIQTIGIMVHLVVFYRNLSMIIENSLAGVELLNSDEDTEAYIELNQRIQKGVGFRQHDK